MEKKKGKCFSACDRGQRKESDFYRTSSSLTKQLLNRVTLEGPILEPACGKMDIVNVLKQHCKPSFIGHSDIRGPGRVDFLKIEPRVTYWTIITNPPLSLAQEFILKAKTIAQSDIYFLMPLSYLHGQKRFEQIWTDTLFPLKEIFVFTRYPMLTDRVRKDGRYNTGMIAWAWYHWKKEHVGEPIIRWIDNNQYVLNSKKNEA